MDPAWSEEKGKLRREKSREAIALALQGQWERAIEVNSGILRLFPEEVEALNRLGKACLEVGRYSEAREAFETSAKIAPHNAISKKNLERLAHLQETAAPPKHRKAVMPSLLIEESGRSGITLLQKPAGRHVLAKMAAGDGLRLQTRDHALVVENSHGEYLGKVEPKLATRLIRFVNNGNRYDAAVISVNHQEISVIIWEAYRHPSLGNIFSFPTRSKDEYKAYWKDALLRHDIDSEREEDEEFSSERRESYADGAESSDGEEPSVSNYSSRAAEANPDDDL